MSVSCDCSVLSEVSATGRSLVQRSPTDYGASLCMNSKPQNEEAKARVGAQSPVIAHIPTELIKAKSRTIFFH